MPTARPIMEASIGVMSEIVSVNSVASWTPRSPTPTPITAESSGMPAATKEPNVMSRTTAATARPISSEVMFISCDWNAMPLYCTLSRSAPSYLSSTSVISLRCSDEMSMTAAALKVTSTVPVFWSGLTGESCARSFSICSGGTPWAVLPQ